MNQDLHQIPDTSIVTVLGYMHAKCRMLNASLIILVRDEEVRDFMYFKYKLVEPCVEIGIINKVESHV